MPAQSAVNHKSNHTKKIPRYVIPRNDITVDIILPMQTNFTNFQQDIDFNILLCYIKNVQKLINFTGVPFIMG